MVYSIAWFHCICGVYIFLHIYICLYTQTYFIQHRLLNLAFWKRKHLNNVYIKKYIYTYMYIQIYKYRCISIYIYILIFAPKDITS